MSECELLGGIFSYLIQLFLGLVAIGSLVYKRHIEKPQRSWEIWFYDVTKQLFGGFLVHCLNILVSKLLKGKGDECALYFLNFFIDCTIGVGIVYLVHNGICYLVSKYISSDTVLSHIGNYGNPPKVKVWIKQLFVYLTALSINKLIIGFSMYGLKKQILYLGDLIFHPIQEYPNVELVIVMILCPWILTTLQFWIFDHMLKGSNEEIKILDLTNPILDYETIESNSLSSVTLDESTIDDSIN